MKKLATLLCLCSFTMVKAQRNADLDISLITPYNNQQIPSGGQCVFDVLVTNAGVDSLRAADSVRLSLEMDGAPVQFWNGTQMVSYRTLPAKKLMTGDTMHILQNMALSYLPDDTYYLCAKVVPVNAADPVSDPDTTNNAGCSNFILGIPSGIGTTPGETVTVNAFPNPARHTLHLDIRLHKQDDIRIHILDMTGRIVWSESRTLSSGRQVISLPLTAAAAGNYVYRVCTEDGVIYGKFIIE